MVQGTHASETPRAKDSTFKPSLCCCYEGLLLKARGQNVFYLMVSWMYNKCESLWCRGLHLHSCLEPINVKGRPVSPHPAIFLQRSSVKLPCHSGVNVEQNLRLQGGWIPLPSSRALVTSFPSLSRFSTDRRPSGSFVNRDEKLSWVLQRGFQEAWVLLGSEPSS